MPTKYCPFSSRSCDGLCALYDTDFETCAIKKLADIMSYHFRIPGAFVSLSSLEVQKTND